MLDTSYFGLDGDRRVAGGRGEEMNIKPNTVLPKGGKLIKPITKKTGGWVSMTFDAKVKCAGVTWLRIKGGHSGKGDREDWVADIPEICAGVNDYMFRPPYWGIVKYPSFEAACKAQLESALEQAAEEAAELQAKLARLRKLLASHANSP